MASYTRLALIRKCLLVLVSVRFICESVCKAFDRSPIRVCFAMTRIVSLILVLPTSAATNVTFRFGTPESKMLVEH